MTWKPLQRNLRNVKYNCSNFNLMNWPCSEITIARESKFGLEKLVQLKEQNEEKKTKYERTE